MLNHWHFRVSNNYGCYCEGCSYACKRTNLSNNGPTCKLHSKVGHLRHYPCLSGTPSFPFRYGQDPDDFEYAMSEFLRMNGMYWGVACMDLMDRLSDMDRWEHSPLSWLSGLYSPFAQGGNNPVSGRLPRLGIRRVPTCTEPWSSPSQYFICGSSNLV